MINDFIIFIECILSGAFLGIIIGLIIIVIITYF